VSAPARDAIQAGCEWLAERDDALARAYLERGVPAWRAAPCGFETLARMIAYQQISTKAGAAIWSRVLARAEAMTPAAILAMGEADLCGAGLSRPKARYLKAIAEAVDAGALCFEDLQAMAREDAIAALTAVKGIGSWSAELFLMYTTGDLDAFPKADVGLMESYRLLSGAEARHPATAFTELAAGWSPYRGVATHLLWAWLNHHRDGAAAPPAREG